MPTAYPITAPIYSCDVIVIGASFAGLVAALSAAEQGASVILADTPKNVFQAPLFGPFCINAIEPELQGEQGISDSPDFFYRQTLASGEFRADAALVKNLCYKAYGAKKWLEGKGIHFSRKITQVPGGDFPRANVATDPFRIDSVLREAIRSRKGRIIEEVEFLRFLTKRNNLGGAVFKNSAGNVILTAPSTVLAYGGFDADADLLAMFDPRLKGIKSFKAPRKNTILREAVKLGAVLVGTGYNDLLLGTESQDKFIDLPFHPSEYILVDSSGSRVADESSREQVEGAVLQADKKTLWMILSAESLADLSEEDEAAIAGLVTDGIVLRLPSDFSKAPFSSENLLASLRTYNRDLSQKKPDAFGKINRSPIKRTNLLAIPATLRVRSTLGGVLINEETAVLNARRRPIPGLFACGEVTGGIHGKHCVPGNFMLDALVNGISAGEAAAACAKPPQS